MTAIENIKGIIADYNGQMQKENEAKKQFFADILEFSKLVAEWLKATNRHNIRLGASNQCMTILDSQEYQFTGVISRKQLDTYREMFYNIVKDNIERSEERIKTYYTSKA